MTAIVIPCDLHAAIISAEAPHNDPALSSLITELQDIVYLNELKIKPRDIYGPYGPNRPSEEAIATADKKVDLLVSLWVSKSVDYKDRYKTR